MAATMTSIAKEAGVSVTLVSRLLRNDPTLRITEGRRRQIMAIHKRVGDVRTRTRRRRLSHVIVTPVNEVFSADFVQVSITEAEPFRSFIQELGRKGFRLFFDFVSHDRMTQTIRSLITSSTSCDGLLILSGICSQEMADDLRAADFPHVSHDFRAERYQINTVHAHITAGTTSTVEHLYSLGHRRIGYLGLPSGYNYSPLMAALATMRLPLEESLNCWIGSVPPSISPSQLRDHARRALGGWIDRGELGRPEAPTAMVCGNDYIALGAVDAMEEHGLCPGRELSVAGYDNMEVRGPRPAERPILTTVDNPVEKIGRRMAELLLNQILHGQTQVVHERLPASLVVRETTGPCLSAASATV